MLFFIHSRLASVVFIMSALVFIFHLELMYRYQTHKRIPSLPECGLKMTIGNLLLMMIMSFLVFKLLIKLEIFHVVLYWFYQALVFFYDVLFTHLYNDSFKTVSATAKNSGSDLLKANFTLLTILVFWQLRNFYFHAWAEKNDLREQLDYKKLGITHYQQYRWGAGVFFGLFMLVFLFLICNLPIGEGCSPKKASLSCLNTNNAPMVINILFLVLWSFFAVFFNYCMTSAVRNHRVTCYYKSIGFIKW